MTLYEVARILYSALYPEEAHTPEIRYGDIGKGTY
jgi:hypothetical protein